MSTRSISRRYARALFELIQEGCKIQPSLGNAAQVASLSEVKALLSAPHIPSEVKGKVIGKVAGNLSKEVARLITILSARNKVELLPEINEILNEMIQQAGSEVEVEVTSATSLDAALKGKIVAALGRQVGGKVKMKTSLDPDIMGGLVVRVGDRQMDFSLRTRLEMLKREMIS